MYCLLNDKKYVQKVWSKNLVYKKPFGYRVIHWNTILHIKLPQHKKNFICP